MPHIRHMTIYFRTSNKVKRRVTTANRSSKSLRQLSSKCLLNTCSISRLVSKRCHPRLSTNLTYSNRTKSRMKRLRSRPPIIILTRTRARGRKTKWTRTRRHLPTIAEGQGAPRVTHVCSPSTAKSEIVTSIWKLHCCIRLERVENWLEYTITLNAEHGFTAR